MEKSYTNLLYSLQRNQIPINKGKKIQIKVQAENSNKAIGKDKLQVKKEKKILCRPKSIGTEKNIDLGLTVQNLSTYIKMEGKKRNKTSLPTVPD